MFQVFLIIFWATIRLQSRGEASGTDESVPYKICGGCGRDRITPHPSQATPSPQGEGNSGCTRGCGASGTDESVPYEICGGCGRD